MIDTWSEEWRRLTEARWVLRECRNIRQYTDGVKERRGEAGHLMLLHDINLVKPHINNFTKRVAAELIEQMKGST